MRCLTDLPLCGALATPFVCCAPSRPDLPGLLFSSRCLLRLAGAARSWAGATAVPVGTEGPVLSREGWEVGEAAAGLDFSSGEQELGESTLLKLLAEPWSSQCCSQPTGGSSRT